MGQLGGARLADFGMCRHLGGKMEQMVTELRRIRQPRHKQVLAIAGPVAMLVATLVTVVALRLAL